jgi:hypothetical protein
MKLTLIRNINKIHSIEKDIFDVKQEIFNLPKKLKNPGWSQNVLEGHIERNKRPLLHKLDLLETERNFLLAEREALLPKTIWNIIVPIIVSVITALVITKLNLK